MKKNLLLLLLITVLAPWSINAQDFPTLSKDGASHWYGIYSIRSSNVIKSDGVGNVTISGKYHENTDEVNWKFEATGKTDAEGDETFKIVSRAGGELKYVQFIEVGENNGNYHYENDELEGDETWSETKENEGEFKMQDRFMVVAAGQGNEFSFKQFNTETGNLFQIQFSPAPVNPVKLDPEDKTDNSEFQFVNMTNHTAPRNEICAYKKDDAGNKFSVYQSEDELYQAIYPDGLPAKFSTLADPIWYQLKICRNGNVFSSIGIDENLAQATLITTENLEQENQQFLFEGDPDGFKVVCRTGGELKFDGTDRIQVVSSGSGDLFTFKMHDFQNYGKKWEIYHLDKGKGINETAGSACLYGSGDAGNALEIIGADVNPFEGAPEISTADAPKWYYIQNLRNNKVLASLGSGNTAAQRPLTKTDGAYEAQMFRFDGTYDSFKIICRAGGAVYYNDGGFIAIGEESEADNFIFHLSTSKEFPGWAIKHIRESLGINMDNKEEKANEVVLYNPNDPGSSYAFLTYEEAVVGVSETKVGEAQLIVADGTLTVEGENIANVTVYDITGRQSGGANQTTFTLSNAGCYIVSITYVDGSKQSTKVMIK